jgi:hypothetical protein
VSFRVRFNDARIQQDIQRAWPAGREIALKARAAVERDGVDSSMLAPPCAQALRPASRLALAASRAVGNALRPVIGRVGATERAAAAG